VGVKEGCDRLVKGGLEKKEEIIVEPRKLQTVKSKISNWSIPVGWSTGIGTKTSDNHTILRTFSDIPNDTGISEKSPQNPQRYEDIIHPPEIKVEDNEFQVELYTWTRLSGVLLRWNVTKGEKRTHIQSECVTSHLGNYQPVSTDIGPGGCSSGTVVVDLFLKNDKFWN